ncbi:TetR family transcriptional regulator [Streptomyces liangshanensis]|uniref:TetR family transcriptional regulator n=1 Tax=Streptomyces liangshanensis TaxID=2717324 RepID=UPI0036DD20B7
MARSADETRRKILDAAADEFAQYGIAGARVDRITTTAGVNNALLYRYFGGKLELFDVVYSHHVTEIVEAVDLNPEDLPGYVGRLYDYYEAHPHVVRLAAWHQLERPDHAPPEAVRDAQAKKAEKIARAQKEGRIPADIPAEELRDLMVLLSLGNSPMAPSLGGGVSVPRRATVVAAARAVLEAGPGSTG